VDSARGKATKISSDEIASANTTVVKEEQKEASDKTQS
tara:strand:- start:132 stop:245 length:114 start_codon:yes stop_codon:yes gene_type:complete